MAASSKEIFVEQGTPEWFEARKGRATSSEINSIYSKGKDGTSNSSATRKNYVNKLAVERIVGYPIQTYKSESMQRGNDLEAMAGLAYEFKTGRSTRTCGFYARQDKMSGSSPDRVVILDGGLVQIKCFEATEHKEVLKKQSIPPKYRRQMIDELANVPDAPYNDFVSFHPDFPENAQIYIERIERADVLDEIAEMEQKKTDFLREVAAEVKFIENYKEDA